ncbi:hypothetical protein AAEU31_15060 [Pseudoalteromonas sp. SSMSWG5]|uniref:hypothetical protein n=1 Tax=Pseudoalteromonas sp. SSMSWG5 TaxID=3139396 RepID=UPI003BAD899D
MNFETYILSTSLPIITSDYIFSKPSIPRKKLLNALNEYGRGIAEEDVITLIDDTFWRSGKEGLLITNNGVYFSSRTSEIKKVLFDDIEKVSCNDCQLIINNNLISRLTYAEKMPLAFLFSVLNSYAITSKKVVDSSRKVKLDEETLVLLEDLIYRIQNTPVFYDPNKNRTFGPNPELITKVSALKLTGELSSEQLDFIAFQLKLEEEKVLAVSFLSSSPAYSDFFCITDCGIYLSYNNSNEIFISFCELKNLKTISESENSRYWEVEFSNGIKVLTSIQNGFTKPFSKTLLDCIIHLLNHDEINTEILNRYAASSIEMPNKNEPSTLGRNPSLKLKFISNDDLYDFIKNMNRLDKVTSFITSPSDPRSAPLTKLKEDFQSLVVKNVSRFRKSIIEDASYTELKNDYATLEVIVFSTAYARMSMLKRGLDINLSDTIILEGLKLIFGERGNWQNSKYILAVRKIEKSYFEDKDFIVIFIGRLFFVNITKSINVEKALPKLVDEGNFTLDEIEQDLTKFAANFESKALTFQKHIENNTHNFIDKSLDLVWSLR